MGNKQVKTSVAIRDIPGIIHDNQGDQILPVKMTNDALVPDCAFNLFSISKRLKQGWSLGGRCLCIGIDWPQWKELNQV